MKKIYHYNLRLIKNVVLRAEPKQIKELNEELDDIVLFFERMFENSKAFMLSCEFDKSWAQCKGRLYEVNYLIGTKTLFIID